MPTGLAQPFELSNRPEPQKPSPRCGRMGNAPPGVLQDVSRIIDTSVSSLGVLGHIITDPRQAARLGELVSKHDFPGLLRSLSNRSAPLPPDFFPSWIRRAGGYFPKFAQVLSVRADLIDDPQVLAGFARCLEDMPSRSLQEVRCLLQRQHWELVAAGLGDALNAGTVAQVHALTMQDLPLVLKVTFPDTRQRFETDFCLFEHAQTILKALKLNDDEKAKIVLSMFDAVGKSKRSVLKEFDLRDEAQAMRWAADLLVDWEVPYHQWQTSMLRIIEQRGQEIPHEARTLLQMAMEHARTWKVAIPEAVDGFVEENSLVMTWAAGESLHQLLTSDGNRPQEAAMVFLALAVPFLGWLLLCKSSSTLAHVDPHLGNFRWDAPNTLWVLDWGSTVRLDEEKRQALALLVGCLAADADDGTVADVARRFGIAGQDHDVARVVRGLFNASCQRAANEALEEAVADDLLQNMQDDIVPVVRCLAILGGILKMMQQRIRDEHHRDIPLSLALLWAPFSEMSA